MDLSEFISRCQSDEIETFCDEEINNAHAEFRRKMIGLNEAFRIKPVCFENFIYYLRNERWSDARVFRSGAIKEYLMLPSNRKLPKQIRDKQATDSDSLSRRVNQSRDSEQKKERKTETELSVSISDNKKGESTDTTNQASSQTELDANEIMEDEKAPINSEQTESKANSESNQEEKIQAGSESERGDKYENENKSKTHTLEAICETDSIEHAMVPVEKDEEKTNATEADEKDKETSKPED
ncbi:hypothetical protein CHS0354_026421 [Potamilus streckersoni]|uniref:Uncharacterized protein n=1 Tax=Potamilus streckersoni TaxID=2493646 RepID=A0AAE0T3D8_9BIVA|nr:hypothetical protein CHS0354_026421 [Potamilus streckersoni]